MKVKVTIWAEVDEDEYNAATDMQTELALITANLIDYDTRTDISREEWEVQDGMEWTEDDEDAD